MIKTNTMADNALTLKTEKLNAMKTFLNLYIKLIYLRNNA